MECTIEKRMKNSVKNNPKVSRRGYVKYAGAVIAVIATATTGAYYFGKPKPAVMPTVTSTITPSTTITVKPTTTVTSVTTHINPVIVEYGDEFPAEVVEKIKVIGEDYKIDENERILLDNLYDMELRRGELEKDFDVTKLENTLADLSIEDNTVSDDTANALKYMQNNRTGSA